MRQTIGFQWFVLTVLYIMRIRDQGPPEIVIFCFQKHMQWQWLHSLLICSFLILSFLTLEIYCTYKIMCLPLCKKMWEFLFPLLLFFFNTLCPWMLWPPKRGSGLFCLIKGISQIISLRGFILKVLFGFNKQAHGPHEIISWWSQKHMSPNTSFARC